jgi:hypothetical protein
MEGSPNDDAPASRGGSRGVRTGGRVAAPERSGRDYFMSTTLRSNTRSPVRIRTM